MILYSAAGFSRHNIRYENRIVRRRFICFICMRHILPAAVYQESIYAFRKVNARRQVCHRAKRYIQSDDCLQLIIYIYRRLTTMGIVIVAGRRLIKDQTEALQIYADRYAEEINTWIENEKMLADGAANSIEAVQNT